MRIVACALIAGAALLGLVPVAMADALGSATSTTGLADTAGSDSQAAPQAEVSLLAVALTAGGAVATAGSGMALMLTRRRELSRRPS